MRQVSIIDSHTAGEPTRVVIAGGPDLGTGPLELRRQRFLHAHDTFRSAVINEPRGSDVLVGALLLPPLDPTCCAAVIFFNNVGYLNMCGHGTIGVAVTLAHLQRIRPGSHKLETPVGVVPFTLDHDNRVSLDNVPSYRHASNVPAGDLTGDIAWGGNWFFLAHLNQPLHQRDAPALTARAAALLSHLHTLPDCPPIDHIEFTGPPGDPSNHARNFVLCPGGAYDRSPCGTGTSAKLACLAAAGQLAPGQTWRQEGILGTVFESTYRWADDSRSHIIPTITGSAYLTSESTLLFDPRDPFREGIRS